MNGAGGKRQASRDALPGSKRIKTEDTSRSGMSFAERMLRKQGWSEGQSLGKTGNEGIREAIQVKLRPQGVGLGSVKEMTPQAKAEARRAAENRGEKYESSSEDDSLSRMKRNKLRKQQPATQTSRPLPQKAQFRLENLQMPDIPPIFRQLIDMTGSEPRILDSAAGSMGPTPSSRTNEAQKIATAARRELEAFDQAWREIQDRRIAAEFQSDNIAQDVTRLETEVSASTATATTVASINSISQRLSTIQDDEIATRDVCHVLVETIEELSKRLDLRDNGMDLSEIAVAAIHPVFKSCISTWQPLASQGQSFDTLVMPLLEKLQHVLLATNVNENGIEDPVSSDAIATPYESLILSLWLPPVRSFIVNDWQTNEPDALVDFVKVWRPLLPPSVFSFIVNQLIVQRLASAVESWKPSSSRRSGKQQSRPHAWLFPWLEFVDPYHMDAKTADGLLGVVRRQLRSVIERYNPDNGIIDGLSHWIRLPSLRKSVKRDLETKMLPRLAHYLRDVEINPLDQKLHRLENYLAWQEVFPMEKLCRALLTSIFPDFYATLHAWLLSDPDYEEIGSWLEWWTTVLPAEARHIAAVQQHYIDCLALIGEALGLSETANGATETPIVVQTTRTDATPVAMTGDASAATEGEADVDIQESPSIVEIKDYVEELCEAQGILFQPLRRTHQDLGHALFRITANAVGEGGRVVFFRDGILWAQSKRDRNDWEPVDILADNALSNISEGV